MKKIAVLLLMIPFFAAVAAERITVMQPVNTGASPADCERIWDALEDAVRAKATLVTRREFAAMLHKMKRSDVVLKELDYLIGVNIVRMGATYSVTLVLIEAKNGEPVPGAQSQLYASSVEEVTGGLPGALDALGIGSSEHALGRITMLDAVDHAGGRLATEAVSSCAMAIENALIERNFNVVTLKSASKALAKKGIRDTTDAGTAVLQEIGEILNVEYLIRPEITRCEVEEESALDESGYTMISDRDRDDWEDGWSMPLPAGYFEGEVRIISAASGNVVKTVPFQYKLRFSTLDPSMHVRMWKEKQYYAYLVVRASEELAGDVADALK